MLNADVIKFLLLENIFWIASKLWAVLYYGDGQDGTFPSAMRFCVIDDRKGKFILQNSIRKTLSCETAPRAAEMHQGEKYLDLTLVMTSLQIYQGFFFKYLVLLLKTESKVAISWQLFNSTL